jgi:predicted nuclease with TOPRIM domain
MIVFDEASILRGQVAELTSEKSALLDRLEEKSKALDIANEEVTRLKGVVAERDAEIDALTEDDGDDEWAELDEADDGDCEEGVCPMCQIAELRGVVAVLWNRLNIEGIDCPRLLRENGLADFRP